MIAIVAAASLCATQTYAADLPSRAPPPIFIPPIPAPLTWTGCYIGGFGGFDYARDRNQRYETDQTVTRSPPTTRTTAPTTTTIPATTVTTPDTTVTTPATTITTPATTVTGPDQTITTPAHTTVALNSDHVPITVTVPASTAIVPGQTVTVPAQTVTVPASTTIVPGQTVTVPAQTVTVPGQTITVPGTQTVTTSDTASSYAKSLYGGDGGGRVGCNYQTGNFVLGGQLEGGYLGISGTVADPTRPSTFSTVSAGAYGAASVKLGYALGERTLLFVRGGVAYADLRYQTTDYTFNYATSVRGTGAMPLVGGGLEYKLTPNVSLTGEYTYLHAGCRSSTYSYMSPGTNTGGRTTVVSGSGTESTCIDKHMVTFGLNYYFNAAPAAVVARY